MIPNIRVNALSFGSVLNIGNGPQCGQSVYNGAKGRKAAHQFVMRPKAAKWLIIVYREANFRYLVYTSGI